REVLVSGGQETLRLTASTVLINTGTMPAVPPVEGAEVGGRIHDSETIQHIDPVPGSLVVVGGGYVGLEFASIFAHFGARVTVLDMAERALPDEDEDVAQVAAKILADDGVDIVTGAAVTSIADEGEHGRVAYTAAD